MNPAAPRIHAWQVTQGEAGRRLDCALGQVLGLSRQQVKLLLEQGAVRVDGRRQSLSSKGRPLETGQAVSVTTHEPAGQWQAVAQPESPLAILGESDEDLLLDKPAGVAVHPLRPDETGTLLNAVIARWPDIHGVGEGGLRSGVVHRLDVETSGVIVMARTQARWQQLRNAFAEHRTRKHYMAVVAGQPPSEKEVALELCVTRHSPAYVSVAKKPGDKRSRTCDLSWVVTQRLPGASVLDIRLGTGFLHQIRVMMAHLGHPVLGDAVYGHDAPLHPPPPRLMLHAHSLEVEGLRATSLLPSAMQAYIRTLAQAVPVMRKNDRMTFSD